MTPNPGFKVTVYFKGEYLKNGVFGTKSDPWSGFQDRSIIEMKCMSKTRKDRSIATREWHIKWSHPQWPWVTLTAYQGHGIFEVEHLLRTKLL